MISLVSYLSQTSEIVRVRVSRKTTIVIPEKIAEILGIDEGTILEMSVVGDSLVLKPKPSAIDLALRGKKFAKITLEELERISIERQREYIKK